MFSEKLKVVFQTFLTLLILVSAGFLSALTTMRFAIRGQIVAVPSLVGMSVAEGERRLAATKLLLKVETRVYNDTYAEGVIISQDPPVGAQVKTRSRVSVISSLGKRKVPIPDLVEGTLRAAQIDFIRRGLALGLVASVTNAAVEKDHIIAQEPPANSKEVLSPTVNVLISHGPAEEAFLVPDFIGMDVRKASDILTREGFVQGPVNVQPYPDVAGGVVIAQQPAVGSKILAGSTVTFTISK